MSKASEKFFEKIHESAMTQKYDEVTVEKLLNMIVVSKMLSERESRQDVAKLLLNISIVGESLAKKLYALKNK